MSEVTPYRLTFLQSLQLQINVIGALIMREAETRYGHSRMGIVWMFAEPLMLGLAVSIIKVYMGIRLPPGVPVIMYGIICYLPFYMFRSLISRSSGALQANMTLLFHRNVTLLDVMIARSMLELMSIIGVVVLIELAAGFMINHWPAKPMTLIGAMLLMALFGHGLGMMVAALTAAFEATERMVHMITYMTMPVSGAMFMMENIPPQWREMLLWVPLPHIHEMARDGQFGTLLIHHYDISYVVYWVIGVNLIGMLALRAIRPKLTVFG